MRPPTTCGNCGTSLDAGDAFCSTCGAAASTPGDGDRNRQFRRRIDDLRADGWTVDLDAGDRKVLVDREFGSLWVHAVLLVLTAGAGNLLYAGYRWGPGAERLEVRADGTERYLSERMRNRFDTDRLGSALATLLGVGLFLLTAAFLTMHLTPITLALALVSFAGSLYAFPPTGRRIRSRKGLSTFGVKAETDERVASKPTKPCTVCAGRVDTGVERTFRRRRYVAGIPIETLEEGTNVYCRSCAAESPSWVGSHSVSTLADPGAATARVERRRENASTNRRTDREGRLANSATGENRRKSAKSRPQTTSISSSRSGR